MQGIFFLPNQIAENILMKNWFKILRIVLLTLILATVAWILPHLSFDDSLQNWVPANSPLISDYKNFLEDFSSDAVIIISLVDGENQKPEILSATLDTVRSRIRKFDNVIRVDIWPPPLMDYHNTPKPQIHSFFLTFKPPSYLNPNRPELVQQLHDMLETTGMEYHIAGTGVIHKAINEFTGRTSVLFLLLGILFLLVTMVVFIRNVRVILITLAIAFGSVSFAMIAAWLLKVQFNMIMAILPFLILFYSTSVSVHIYHHHGAMREVIRPAAIAVLTTCAGFAPFLFDTAGLLRDFGIVAIAGLSGTLFWTWALYYPERHALKGDLLLKDAVSIIPTWWNQKSLVLASLIMLILIPGIFRIKSEINIFSVLPQSNRAVEDYRFIEKNIGPFMPVEYRVDLKQTDRKTIKAWTDSVLRLNKVGAYMGYTSFPVWMSPRQYGYISNDGKSGRIVFYVSSLTTTEGLKLVHAIDHISAQLFSDDRAAPKPTGYASLYVSVAGHLTKSFRESLLMAFLFVFLIIYFFVRNTRLFLASLLPNLFPVLAILGVMGWFHVPLDMVTFPIGCLALGIIVDDTVHYLYWYRKSWSVKEAMEKAGTGCVITSLIYILGFSVFLLSEANPARFFGILSITAIVTALFGDVVLLPFILERISQKSSKK